MNINSFNNYYFKNTSANFKSSRFGDNGTMPANYTYFFRGFNNQILEIMNNYTQLAQKGEKINVLSYGCSDGSEPYSIAIWLKEHCTPKTLENFLPIKACDWDEKIIEKAKSGNIYYSEFDKKSFGYYTNSDISKYITQLNSINGSNDGLTNAYYGKVSDDIRNMIQFEHKSYLDKKYDRYPQVPMQRISIDEKLPDNTILFIRNTLPYTGAYQLCNDIDENGVRFLTPVNYLKDLHKILGKNSVIVFGEYDFGKADSSDKGCPEIFTKALYEAGFEPVKTMASKSTCDNVDYIWKKKDE